MVSAHPHLLSPATLGSLNLPNRAVMAPMSRSRAPNYTANELMAEYYSARASAGLIITEGTHTSVMGRGFLDTPEVFTPEHAKGWRIVTDAVHNAGGRIFCQLWHAGRMSHSAFREGEEGYDGDMAISVAPSAIKRKSESGGHKYTPKGEVEIETPRAMTKAEIEKLPDEFYNAAKTAKDGGFDGVEVHCANGFLLDTFLQSSTNKRTDEYGGSFENRFRVVEMVLKRVFEVFEPERVGVRLSPNGFGNGMGSEDNTEAFLYYAKRFDELGVGYLHVLNGLDFGFHGYGEPMKIGDFRKVYGGKLICNLGYTAESGNKEIEEGNADLVAFGRPFLSNPDFVKRIETGEKLRPGLSHEYWYSTADHKLTTEGYTDLSVLEEEDVDEQSGEDKTSLSHVIKYSGS